MRKGPKSVVRTGDASIREDGSESARAALLIPPRVSDFITPRRYLTFYTAVITSLGIREVCERCRGDASGRIRRRNGNRQWSYAMYMVLLNCIALSFFFLLG